jgi:plasmid stability protein
VKTVNLSIPDDVWREARIEAAKHNTSLSGLMRAYLVAMVQGKAPVLVGEPAGDSDRRSRENLLAALQSTDLVLGYEPSRTRTYER